MARWEAGPHRGLFMHAGVVHHQLHVQGLRDSLLDLAQDTQELLIPVPWRMASGVTPST